MSTFQPINPKPFLKSLIGKQVIVRLKWNKTEYRGTLISIDNYMNLQLDQTYEIIYEVEDGNETKKEESIGEIFIRCNNVLFVREAKSEPQETEIETETSVATESNGNENGNKEMETD
ncbi:uncharacterized protein SPAPADRAFT_61242 [Spathaspora passalidarum NRRL Y-27907]|uniref:Sm protein F n=1 Tax=Spathaspora passalidarum (strain NRRL Y-27907 / 11-Y1) TaxID=619300 RepID=G3API8_SPAPN|nr:uncharacterized protein SPAPADRAFT_61242 [Spathaspora passalidarum NRRL Y-27907]EGW32159.1 hypothetical protein SPAPADRAFT_61242 [Spathaspora passalidarum NRRL Y-27907]